MDSEPDGGGDAQRDEESQNHQLDDFERWIILGRSQFFQRRYFLKGLHHQHDHVEVKSQQGANHVGLAPRARKVTRVFRKNRNGEDYQRDDTGHDSGRNAVKGKEETRYDEAGQNCEIATWIKVKVFI